MNQGRQKTNDNENIKASFFARERRLGINNIIIEINNIKVITYPKITFVIARYVIVKRSEN